MAELDRTNTIKEFIVDQYLADATVDQLRDDYDLIRNGVVDSLGLLRLIAWLEDRFQISANDTALTPNDFRTVTAIDDFVARALRVRQGQPQSVNLLPGQLTGERP